MAPRSQEPTSSHYDAEFLPVTPPKPEPSVTDTASIPASEDEDQTAVKSKTSSWFDLDVMSCCGMGNKGTCTHCGQLILNSQMYIPNEDDPETFVHSECQDNRHAKAKLIQSRARGNMGRRKVGAIRAEKKRREEEARRRELARRAEAEARRKAEEEARRREEEQQRELEEEDLEEVDLDDKEQPRSKPKKSVFGKLFGGCRSKKSTTEAVFVDAEPVENA